MFKKIFHEKFVDRAYLFITIFLTVWLLLSYPYSLTQILLLFFFINSVSKGITAIHSNSYTQEFGVMLQ